MYTLLQTRIKCFLYYIPQKLMIKLLNHKKIKISLNRADKQRKYCHRHFCPFKLLRQFLQLRGNYENENEQLFIFRDRNPLLQYHSRNLLKILINRLDLDARLYGMHSFRIGRTTDLVKYHYPREEIKLMGRWRSNVVFKYIKQ